MTDGRGWREAYLDGSKDAEDALIDRFTRQIVEVQAGLAGGPQAQKRRAFHAHMRTGAKARFQVMPDIPDALQVGLFQPGADYEALVRFSNASGATAPDPDRDLRGVAVRVTTDGSHTLLSTGAAGNIQDFLMTNAPASHARDPVQFMDFALVRLHRWTWLPRLVLKIGPAETIRMLNSLRVASSREVVSLAAEQYWGRAPVQFGDAAVKFKLQPSDAPVTGHPGTAPDYLREDLKKRLKSGDVTFDFKVQFFTDETRTPIEDGVVEWKESDSPFMTVAKLVIPQQDLDSEDARATESMIERLAFNPWNAPGELRPLGSLNRARLRVYRASVEASGR